MTHPFEIKQNEIHEAYVNVMSILGVSAAKTPKFINGVLLSPDSYYQLVDAIQDFKSCAIQKIGEMLHEDSMRSEQRTHQFVKLVLEEKLQINKEKIIEEK